MKPSTLVNHFLSKQESAEGQVNGSTAPGTRRMKLKNYNATKIKKAAHEEMLFTHCMVHLEQLVAK